ncbi:MAG: DsrE family protein [Halanaerobium sp.]|nr:DsrE family protein [Halanaerobium sp.]
MEDEHLVVIWSSGDREVALKMVFMYTLNAKMRGWWEKVTLVVWGPSSHLLSQDEELQDYLAKMKEEGVQLRACKACADEYGVSETLEGLGIDVCYMGEPLTVYLKEGSKVITF